MFIGQSMYCTNCEQLLSACENTFLSMQYLHDVIRRRNLPFCQNLYSLLGMTLKDGMQNFADLVLEGKNRFEEYNSLEIQLSLKTLVIKHIPLRILLSNGLMMKFPQMKSSLNLQLLYI